MHITQFFTFFIFSLTLFISVSSFFSSVSSYFYSVPQTYLIYIRSIIYIHSSYLHSVTIFTFSLFIYVGTCLYPVPSVIVRTVHNRRTYNNQYSTYRLDLIISDFLASLKGKVIENRMERERLSARKTKLFARDVLAFV